MAGEEPLSTSTPRGSTPVPDPTELTDRAIAKLKTEMISYIDGQLEVRDERLRGIDLAHEVRFQTIDGLHNESRDWVSALKELHGEKLSAIQTQFKERDIRSERESRDNKVAVDAAFAAQKEAAARQDEANAKAIDKSERATTETIKTNQELNQSKTNALQASIDDLKVQVAAIQAQKAGAIEQRIQTTDSRGALYATIGIVITIVLAVLTILAFIIARVPS